MHDESLPMPHAVVLQRLTGTGPRVFSDIVASVKAQGIEPEFLRDPRVIRLSLDDLIERGLVWCINAHMHPAENDLIYVRAHDPTGDR